MKIDGKQIANIILEELKTRVKNLKEKVTKIRKRGITPHLVIILINKNPASIAYIKQKQIKGNLIGTKITVKHFLRKIKESDLLKTIGQLNNYDNVHGIIIQRPLPSHINTRKISQAINPDKDVDGFSPKSEFQPPITKAVLRILEEVYPKNSPPRSHFGTYRMVHPFVTPRMVARQRPRLLRGGFREWLTSKRIVVIGKGETGGKPIISMFKKIGIAPITIDSKTINAEILTKKADIIISAVGKPEVVKPEMLKKGVILIGIGLCKGSDEKMHGDYDQEKITNIASFYTPTPGGVGPVNVAYLLKNLVTAAES